MLLRDALIKSGQSAVVKVALRSREALALIRPVDGVLRLHTMLWPDELRDGSFAAPPEEVKVSGDTVMAAMATTTRAMPDVIEVLGRGRHSGVPVMCQPEVDMLRAVNRGLT